MRQIVPLIDLLSPQNLIAPVQTPEPENSHQTNASGNSLIMSGRRNAARGVPAPPWIQLFAEANWTGDWRITGHRETSASRSSSYHRDLSTHGGLDPHLQDSSCLWTTKPTICPTSRYQQDVWVTSLRLLTCSRLGTPDSSPDRSGPSIPISVNSTVKESLSKNSSVPIGVQTQSRYSTSGEAHVGGLAANSDHAARYLTTPMHRKAHTI
ncbi:hypothetical protein BS47DRAFT_891935 [Hydnum rufescens UP504]|uniref:Uncharacterized protein n=1 Tax=Hydnum rufescens UP504 TaxID=1448309 RepID=A0A9P6AZI2_9AGAM|nr:hypothetical protein BS47DRAFT_891935 [Hydnum rufescens UP504]